MNPLRAIPALLTVTVLLTLAGCGPNRVETPSRFPAPLMQPLRLSAALDADRAFSTHVHDEKLPPPGRAWRLSVGPASVDWMKTLLAASFTSFSNERSSADLVFRPAIEDVQFSTPQQSKTEFYEAWIKYRVEVLDRGGRTVANWPITAYGKRRDRSLASAEAGMGEALNKAMRDGAAALALELRDPLKVQALLKTRSATPAAASTSGARDGAS
jgi:hypothetical protein